MGMKHIRDTYGVPAKRGGRVEYTDTNGQKWRGTIRSADGAHLRISMEGLRRTYTYHPTWDMVYVQTPYLSVLDARRDD